MRSAIGPRHRPPVSYRHRFFVPGLLLAAVGLGLVAVLVDAGSAAHVFDRATLAGVAAKSAPSTPNNPRPSAHSGAPLPAAAAEVTTRLGQLIARRPATEVSLAALDLTDGSRYRYPADPVIRTASVVKLDILEALLLQHQHSGQPLDDAETTKAAAMIEHSDNDATDALWNEIGGADGLRIANRQLGTRRTSPDAAGYWGLTTSDADDQLTLLRNLLDDQPLTATSQVYALGLLGKIAPDQAWGVSAAADPGTSPALKNGWLNVDDDNDLWAVNSVGIITVQGHQVLLAVLTQHNPSEQDGIDLIQDLATTTVAAVAPAPLPPIH